MKLLFHPVWNFSFTQVVLIVSSFLQNDLLDAPSKSFHWTATTIYNASAPGTIGEGLYLQFFICIFVTVFMAASLTIHFSNYKTRNKL